MVNPLSLDSFRLGDFHFATADYQSTANLERCVFANDETIDLLRRGFSFVLDAARQPGK